MDNVKNDLGIVYSTLKKDIPSLLDELIKVI